MLAVKLHRAPRPDLAKGSWLVPIADWSSGRIQLRKTLQYTRRYRFITLVEIPHDWPVRFLVRYGDSDYIKGVYLFEPRPLRDVHPEIKKALRARWEARKSGWSETGVEPGGLMVNEPSLELAKALPAKHVKWTKDLRLLYRGDERRSVSSGRRSRDPGGRS
jgi:hypothetical protein